MISVSLLSLPLDALQRLVNTERNDHGTGAKLERRFALAVALLALGCGAAVALMSG
ncbi:hypothetical protein [Rhizobacter sp. P5_C2]